MLTNLSHFIFNSDYPMDKVVFYKQEAFTVPARSGQYQPGELTITIPHNLLFTPLPLAIWATDADFSDTRTYAIFSNLQEVKADATNITVYFQNSTDTPLTGYLRVYGLLPTNAVQEAAPTARQASKLIFDTDKLYAPLVFSGIITTDFDSNNVKKINVCHGYKELITQANRVEIEHDLGNYPFMLLWYENNGEIKLTAQSDLYYDYPLDMLNYSDVDKCNVDCGFSMGTDKVHIRIYANV